MPGAFYFEAPNGAAPLSGVHGMFRSPMSPSDSGSAYLSKSANSLMSDASTPAYTPKRKRYGPSETAVTPSNGWPAPGDEGADDRPGQQPQHARGGSGGREIRYTLAGQIDTPNGALQPQLGDHQMEDSTYSDVDYRHTLGAKRPPDGFDPAQSGNAPADLGQPTEPTQANNNNNNNNNWSRLALSTIGGVVGKVWEFCTAGAFRGFYAGGGTGYDTQANPTQPPPPPPASSGPAPWNLDIDVPTMQPAPWNHDHDVPVNQSAPWNHGHDVPINQPAPWNHDNDIPINQPAPWNHDNDNDVPMPSDQYHATPASTSVPGSDYAPFYYENGAPEPPESPDSALRPAKRRQLSHGPSNDELGKNWVVVEEEKPHSSVPVPSHPTMSAPQARPSVNRRISKPIGRLGAPAVNRRHSDRISHAGTPSISYREPASFASPRPSFVGERPNLSPAVDRPATPSRGTPSRLPKAVGRPQTPSNFTPSPRPSLIPSPSPYGSAVGGGHARNHSVVSMPSASLASTRSPPRRRHTLAQEGGPSPRLDAHAQSMLARRKRQEREADARMNDFNARLQEMIRQGREALGTTVEVDHSGGGGGRGGHDAWEDDL